MVRAALATFLQDTHCVIEAVICDITLWARRLYQSQISQGHITWKAIVEIYQIYSTLHLFNHNISESHMTNEIV